MDYLNLKKFNMFVFCRLHIYIAIFLLCLLWGGNATGQDQVATLERAPVERSAGDDDKDEAFLPEPLSVQHSVRIALFKVDESLPYISSATLMRIGGFERYDIFDLKKSVKFLKKLNDRKILQYGNIDFYPGKFGDVDAVVLGQVPDQSFDVGFFFDAQQRPLGGINLSSYTNFPAAGVIDASLRFDASARNLFSSILLPAYHNENSFDEIYFNIQFEKLQYLNRKIFESHYRRSFDGVSASKFVKLRNIHIGLVQSKTEDYVTRFERDDKFIEAGLKFAIENEPDNIFQGLEASGNAIINLNRDAAIVELGLNIFGQKLIVPESRISIAWRTYFSFLAGSFESTPIERRAYLGGRSSLRGFFPREVGGAVRPFAKIGADAQLSGQFEISKDMGSSVDGWEVGWHLDMGGLWRDWHYSGTYMSSGVFVRPKLFDKGQIELFLSRVSLGEEKKVRLMVYFDFKV